MRYQELIEQYRNRRKDGSLDAVSAGLSFVDNALVDFGVLEGADIAADALDVISTALPLATIAITEGARVLSGRKTVAAARQDAIYRTVRTGAAMGAGAVAVGAGLGALPAIPVSMAVRMVLDKYRSRNMTGLRIQRRIERLRALRSLRTQTEAGAPALMPSHGGQ